MSVSGGNTTEITITGLNFASKYSIEVAAVNSPGTGEYSDPLFVTTNGILYNNYIYNIYIYIYTIFMY